MYGVLGNLKATFEESNRNMSAVEFLQSSVLPGASTEMFRRELRIKAFKAFQFLADPKAVYELVSTNITMGPLERILWTMLGWQSKGCMFDDCSSPIAIMASDQSPARLAVRELLRFMISNKFEPQSCDGLSLDELASGLKLTVPHGSMRIPIPTSLHWILQTLTLSISSLSLTQSPKL